MPFSYATPGSGPSAGGIGWFDFGTLTIASGQTITGLTATLNNGATVTFDLTNTFVSGNPTSFSSTTVPTWSLAYFGNPSLPSPNYATIAGNVALRNVAVAGGGLQSIVLSNISVKDANGNLIPNYDVIVADAESTNAVPGTALIESWKWITNGGVWQQLAVLGNPASVATSGAGTQTFQITGITTNNPVASYVMRTHSPTSITMTESNVGGSLEAIAIGFAVTRVTLEKNISARIDATDQFLLDISGTPASQATTSGNSAGIQTQKASVFAIDGNTYTLNESMAPGSGSSLSSYTQTVSVANATPGGTIPPIGNLPITFTPALGDDVTYTVLNVAPETFNKTVDKAFADIGEVLTYTVTINNPNNFAINNVLMTDVTPSGTTYAGNLQVSAAFTGTDPATGITITTIPANGSVTVSWQVKVNTTPPVPDPITNIAAVSVPGGTSGNTNVATTQVRTAFVTMNKGVDKVYAAPGDIVTYTITLNNLGNTDANNVIITDAVPSGTTFVPGSVIGATGTPPTLTLANPIISGGTATVTFQVKIADAIPIPNPIPNSATAAFTYTVNPANPNGANGTAASNLVDVQVNGAIVDITKAVDKAFTTVGDVLTYTLTLKNTGNTDANAVTITDAVPSGTTFIPGSVIGATGTPPTLTLANPIPPGGNAAVTFQVVVGNTIPIPNPVPNNASVAFTYTIDPADPNGASGTGLSNTVETKINGAIVTTAKTVDKAFANVGDTITYTVTVTNSGNVAANNVVLTDALPSGVSFVAGSLIGATGTPPTLTLNSPVPAGGNVIVIYQVKVGNAVPSPNPLKNTVSATFAYTVDPAKPNGLTGTTYGNTVETQINTAVVKMIKSVDKPIAYLNDTVTYQIAVSNTGNSSANNVVITDPIPNGTILVPGSMVVSVPYTPMPGGAIALTNSILPGETVTISFKILVIAMPNPNPMINVAKADYTYTVDPAQPNGVSANAQTNAVTTIVFHNNYRQQISDLIESVALEQAALAALANAEGAKIQRIAATNGVTTAQLLCLNKSVSDMMDSITLLEAILKQKLSVMDCQINGTIC